MNKSIDMPTIERRQYHRIAYIADIEVRHDDEQWKGELIDISLKGLLIQVPQSIVACADDIYDIVLLLGKDASIEMQAKISYSINNAWGLEWQNIDIECFTHLRRLLELNSQDPEIVHREIDKLGTKL